MLEYISSTDNKLLYLHVMLEDKQDTPIEDEWVELLEKALDEGKVAVRYKGFHTTPCGQHSSSCDYLLKDGSITNSLAAFYLKWYRSAIGKKDWERLNSLKKFYEES